MAKYSTLCDVTIISQDGVNGEDLMSFTMFWRIMCLPITSINSFCVCDDTFCITGPADDFSVNHHGQLTTY